VRIQKTLLVLLSLGLLPAWASRVPYLYPIQRTISAAGLTQVVVQNLVGPITVSTTSGNTVSLTIIVHSAGPDHAFARTLAHQLTFTVTQIAGQLRITGVYPLSHFRDYGYPMMKSIMGIHGTDSNVYDGKKVFIRAAGSSKAVELWAEIRLKLPATLALVIRNIYGNVTFRGAAQPGAQPAAGSLDAFTGVGNFSIYRPEWNAVKLETDYGTVRFTDGVGASRAISVKTDNVGSTYLDLPQNPNLKIVTHKDLGFLHNNLTPAKFTKDSDGDSVLQLGNGLAVIHVDMSVGSLYLHPAAGQ
jgi:hypothetical protein